MPENKIQHCSFCNSHKDEVTKLIVGEEVAICSDCIDLCNKLIFNEKHNLKEQSNKNIDAYQIKKFLDRNVIGQETAKKAVSVAIANHYKRINNKHKDLEIQKGNLLLVGPTGSGKTLLVKTVAKYLNVPFVIADATSLTEAGYVGEDVENMISMLLSNSGYSIEKAERGIVFIDEIDKISRKSEHSSITRDVSGEGVQQALLKLVEGTKCRVTISGKRKHPQADTVEVDTTNILFIAGGAFVGLEKIIEHRTENASIGFNAAIKNKQHTDDILSRIIPEDLVKFGMIPEFIGRFTTTVALEALTLPELLKVLTEVDNNFVVQYKYLFSLDNISLQFTDEALANIAQNCINLKTGARGLHTELERVLMPHMYHVARYKELKLSTLLITKELVDRPAPIIHPK